MRCLSHVVHSHFRFRHLARTFATMAPESPVPTLSDARRVLRERFGMTELRPAQESVLRLLLEPKPDLPPSAVAIFPTGGA